MKSTTQGKWAETPFDTLEEARTYVRRTLQKVIRPLERPGFEGFTYYDGKKEITVAQRVGGGPIRFMTRLRAPTTGRAGRSVLPEPVAWPTHPEAGKWRRTSFASLESVAAKWGPPYAQGRSAVYIYDDYEFDVLELEDGVFVRVIPPVGRPRTHEGPPDGSLMALGDIGDADPATKGGESDE